MRGLNTAEMKFMRCTGGHSLLDHTRNEVILEGLNVNPVKKKVAQKWLNNASRIDDIRYPELLIDY
jgi:hypothetical protein